MRDVDSSVKSVSNPYVSSAPPKNWPLLGWNLGHDVEKYEF